MKFSGKKFENLKAVLAAFALTPPVHSEQWPSPITQKTLWARDYELPIIRCSEPSHWVTGEGRLL